MDTISDIKNDNPMILILSGICVFVFIFSIAVCVYAYSVSKKGTLPETERLITPDKERFNHDSQFLPGSFQFMPIQAPAPQAQQNPLDGIENPQQQQMQIPQPIQQPPLIYPQYFSQFQMPQQLIPGAGFYYPQPQQMQPSPPLKRTSPKKKQKAKPVNIPKEEEEEVEEEE